MLTGELRTQIDKFWNDFWSGGESPYTDISLHGPDARFETNDVDRLLGIVAELRRNAEVA